MHNLCSRWLSLAAPGLLMACLGGLSGCDSKGPDGALVKESGIVDPEQKAKVKAFYADRHAVAKKATPRKK